MLILCRRPGEEIVLRCGGEKVVVRMLGYDSELGVRLGVEAARNVEINRAELDAKKQAERGNSRG